MCSNQLSYAPDVFGILACAPETHNESSSALASTRGRSAIDPSVPPLVLKGSCLRPGHTLAR